MPEFTLARWRTNKEKPAALLQSSSQVCFELLKRTAVAALRAKKKVEILLNLLISLDVRCHFESSFSEYTEAIEGQDIELQCTLSDEDGVVVWYKDGKILEADDHVSIVSDEKDRVLRITAVKDSDSGMYRCETSDGRSRTEGELLVKGKL